MATPLGTSFSTNKNAVVQADVRLLEKTVESLIVEFDQEKFGEFLSSGFVSPKAIGNTAKSHRRIALKSLQRLLLKWPAPLPTAPVVRLQKKL